MVYEIKLGQTYVKFVRVIIYRLIVWMWQQEINSNSWLKPKSNAMLAIKNIYISIVDSIWFA